MGSDTNQQNLTKTMLNTFVLLTLFVIWSCRTDKDPPPQEAQGNLAPEYYYEEDEYYEGEEPEYSSDDEETSESYEESSLLDLFSMAGDNDSHSSLAHEATDYYDEHLSHTGGGKVAKILKKYWIWLSSTVLLIGLFFFLTRRKRL